MGLASGFIRMREWMMKVFYNGCKTQYCELFSAKRYKI